MPKCTVHAGFREGDAASYEYEFPIGADDLSTEHRSIVDQRFELLFGLEPAEICDRVVVSWDAIADPGVREFASTLSKRLVKSILIKENRVYLVLGHQMRRDDVVRIRAPRPLGHELRSMVARLNVPGLEEFLIHFRDLREALRDEANCICDEPGEFPSGLEEVGEVRDWGGAFQFYNMASGNALLLQRGGKVAKWDHEYGWGSGKFEEVIQPVADSFAEYLTAYGAYLAAGESQRMEMPFFA